MHSKSSLIIGLVFLTANLCAMSFARIIETERFNLQPEIAPSYSKQQISPNNTDQIENKTTDDDILPSIHISHDISILPQAVQKTRDRLIEAARTANWQHIQAVINSSQHMPTVSYDGTEDPIAYLKEISGDNEGHEILAILMEILNSGYAHVEAGTEREIFIWPYFARIRLEELSPSQRVELFTLITAGDYEDMVSFGAYNFFRLGISPDGTWQFFIAGD